MKITSNLPTVVLYAVTPDTKRLSCSDGVDVKINRRSHDVHERVVVSYDRFGRCVYGDAYAPMTISNVRDGKEAY